MKKLFLFLIILGLMISGCTKEADKVKFGIVTLFIGDVEIKKGMKTVKPAIKMILRAGDRVITGKGSRLDMQMGNFGVLRINQSSEVEMDRLLDASNDSIQTFLKEGQIICKLKKLQKNQDFSVETPTAVVGVRGTTFAVDSSQEEKKSSVAVAEGQVEMANKEEPEKTVTVKENQSAEVSEDKKLPEVLNKIDIKQLKALNDIKKVQILKDIEKFKPDQLQKLFKSGGKGVDVKGLQKVVSSEKVDKTVQKAEEAKKKAEEEKKKAEKKIEDAKKKAEDIKKKIPGGLFK
ncbi:MAG: FecR domain-containing protein [Spirochaetes bacterium]|nr:FecR domain-containing protein [Spirochaetota bacterium]